MVHLAYLSLSLYLSYNFSFPLFHTHLIVNENSCVYAYLCPWQKRRPVVFTCVRKKSSWFHPYYHYHHTREKRDVQVVFYERCVLKHSFLFQTISNPNWTKFLWLPVNGKNLPWVKIIVNSYTILTSVKLVFMLANISANIKPGKFRLRKPWFKAGISMRKYIYLKPSFPLSFHRLCRKIWVKNLT